MKEKNISIINGSIDTVEATDVSILVKGHITCEEQKELYLVALQPYEEFDPADYTKAAVVRHPGGTSDFTFVIDRYAGQADRIYMKYVVIAENVPIGCPGHMDGQRTKSPVSPQYVTVYPPSANQYPYPEATSIKGLQVQMTDDANSLGVSHGGLNCAVNELFYKDAVVQPDNVIPYEFEGETYYFNKGAIESLDAQIQALSANKINVTLIMVYMGQGINPDFPYQVTRHPDYIDGACAAVNTTDYAGTQYWKAACEFIADRYTREDQRYGRVVDYVVGNEVCTAGVWNDMGCKQIDEYVDQYSRTFRIAYTAMKKHYSEVRLHVSLDHHWNSAYTPDQPLRSYKGKDIVDLFNEQMTLQGNIDWCVAFHPYPSDLLDPYIWKDPIPTDDFYTPKITFKNLGVLPDYLSQEHFLYKGRLRQIDLTEQGFNTIDPYSVNDQMVQAAAYCYAYYKARFTPGIHSFIYHRHVDFTGEQIWVGLWNNLQDSKIPCEPYEKKYIYDVFRKIDTPDSLAASAFALPIIGINEWSEVIPGFDPDVLSKMPVRYKAGLIQEAAAAPDSFASDTFAPGTFAPDSFAPDSVVPGSFALNSFAPDTFASGSLAQASASIASENAAGILFNSLAGADDFGRELPLNVTGEYKKTDRYVGIFYFLWLGQHGEKGPYDISEIVKQEPEAIYDDASPLWGKELADYHHWGQPLFNYYFSQDPWVLRKHVQMLTNADVDFLILDATNGVTYKKVYDVLLEILNDTRSQGWKVPQIVFYTNSNSGPTIMDLYEDIYKAGRYRKLWFLWDNKPLIIGEPDQCPDEVKSFFTFRLPQWPNEPKRGGGFPWIDWNRPQEVYLDEKGGKEVISVSVAQHPKVFFGDSAFYGEKGNWGRSYHTKPVWNEGIKHWGYNFIEQWEYALSQDPRIVFVTGWNEWVALRFKGDDERPVKFYDVASEEYSRDIEPMMGGYNDNYYMLLMSYIRKFKGGWPIRKQRGQKTILINDDFSQWDDVDCVYRDFTGDTAPRNHSGFGGVTYRNFTGNNDFDTMKVASDRENIYFYVKTVNPIMMGGDVYSMTLLINSGGTYNKGWKGYDLAVNRLGGGPGSAVVEAARQGWDWETAGKACRRIKNNEMHLAISRQAFGFKEGALTIHFKWVDNIQKEDSIMDFYVSGDTAPDGRLNYVFMEESEN